jgi:acyl dehydratase
MRPAWKEIHDGDLLPSRTIGPLTRTDFVRYQGASGDFNPVHHDELFAQAAGFPTVFSVGMMQAGMLATFAADWFGPERVRRFGVRFANQVWPGETLVCDGTVARAYQSDQGELLVEVDLRCTRPDGSLALQGSATFSFSDEQGV